MKTLRGKKVLVTGGAGFVGSNLVQELVVKHGAEVTVLDDLFTGSLDHLENIACTFIEGSIVNNGLVNACIKGMDVVFHLASRNIILSNENPREDLYVNVGGSFNVFEACVQHNVSRVVYASTSSVYGNPEVIPVKEEDPKNFLNFYSASKFSAEVYARTFFEVFQLPITVVRYSNVYGKNQSPQNPYCGVIGNFIDAAINNEPIRIHGNGTQTRDYTYVHDAVTATIAAAMCPDAVGESYNIGTGMETSVKELAEKICRISCSKSDLAYIPNRDIDNIYRRAIDIEKAATELNYHPEFSIDKGLAETVAWFLHKFKAVSLSALVAASVCA